MSTSSLLVSSKSAMIPEPQPIGPEPESDGDECAIDDSDDVDDTDVVISHRVREVVSGQLRIQEILPFRFTPSFLPLTLSNVGSCLALENAAFLDPAHRCTREKFEYRLSKCSNICFGLFCTVIPSEAADFPIVTLAEAKPVETGRQDGSLLVLFAQAVSTMTTNPVVRAEDVDYPRNWREQTSPSEGPKIGHQSDGRTLCLHSLAVCPTLQGCGLGVMVMKSFLQIVLQARIADRVALICEHSLVGYYERFGFTHLGPSTSEFGGGGWHDMVLYYSEHIKKKR